MYCGALRGLRAAPAAGFWFWAATWFAVQVALPVALASEPAPQAGDVMPAGEPLEYAIVVTGGELLLGTYPDRHVHYLTRTLRPLGLRCTGVMVVDDDVDEIVRALQVVGDRCRLILTTGGLGPTPDDVTRYAVSQYTGIALREHPEVLADVVRRYGVPAEQLRENQRQQTRIPVGGAFLKNPFGTAAGLVFESDGRVVVCLPGPPRELQPMVEQELLPYLERRFGVRPPRDKLMVRLVGIGESQIMNTINQRMPLADDVVVSSLFEAARVDVTFSLSGDAADHPQRLAQLERSLMEHLGDFIYATDATTLEAVVIGSLKRRRETLALVESGSGGGLAAALTPADGAAAVLVGSLVAPSQAQLAKLLARKAYDLAPGAKPSDSVHTLAHAAAEHTEADWTLVVGEVQQDAAGTAVHVAIRAPDGTVDEQRVAVRPTDPTAQAMLATRLLDVLRRRLR